MYIRIIRNVQMESADPGIIRRKTKKKKTKSISEKEIGLPWVHIVDGI